MPSSTAANSSTRGELIEESTDPAQDHRIARRTVKRCICELDQSLGMKRSGDAMQARRRNLPVGITARAMHPIQLLPRAFDKCLTKLKQKRRIPAGGEGNRGVERSQFKNHRASYGANG